VDATRLREIPTRKRRRKGGERSIPQMADKVRLNLQLSQELNKTLDEITESTGSNRTDVIRQALALMKVAHDAKRKGKHLGLVSDADKLDMEIVGLL
jgi:Ribbon-helix-helix protein, copG family